MSSTLTRQRCWVHLEREAAARCPVCTHFYCRECVTEHDGRVVCASCLRDVLAAAASAHKKGLGAGGRKALMALLRVGQLICSLALTWVFFQLLGQWLLTTASEFHQSDVWAEQFMGGGSSDGTNKINKDKNDRSDADEEDDDDSKTVKEGKAGEESR